MSVGGPRQDGDSVTNSWLATMIGPGPGCGSAPRLRTCYTLATGHGRLVRADLRATALGVLDLRINGVPVGPDVLTPGWSSFEWRTRFVEYDILAHHRAPVCVMTAELGNGWYRGRLGHTGESHLYGDELGVLAELRLLYEDGAEELVITGEHWRWAEGAVLTDDLYDGQTIDARRRDDSWYDADFDDSAWTTALMIPFDKRTLVPYCGPLVTRQEVIRPEAVREHGADTTLVDFGQNIVGWVQLRVRGPRGSEVVVRHAEVLEDGDLGVRPLRSARATDRYVLSGAEDTFEPTFTYHGFRYAEITGWPGGTAAITDGDVSAVVVGSDLRRTGHLETSDPRLNRLHANIVRSMRGNFLAVPTDCPQRDERLGWTGDLAVFAPTAAFLFDVEGFLRDWLGDLAVEQADAGGAVPYVVPDVLKKLRRSRRFGRRTESTAVWSDAAVWVPWALWRAYGHRQVLEESLSSMIDHVDHIATRLSSRGLWEGDYQFGDWLDPDSPPGRPGEAKTDPVVVATAAVHRSARMVAQAAALLGRHRDAERMAGLADRLRHGFRAAFVRGGLVTNDAATAYALAIVFGLLDEAERIVAGWRLAELIVERGHTVATGFVGTPFVLDALADTGHEGDAFALLMQTRCPSWLYSVSMGATTVWERWDSMLPDGRINPGDMTSFNHYALGAVADWMHRRIGGIAPLTPGYGRVLVAPLVGGGLTWAQGRLLVPGGQIAVRWELHGTRLDVDVEVPGGVEAVVRLPGRGSDIVVGPGRSRHVGRVGPAGTTAASGAS